MEFVIVAPLYFLLLGAMFFVGEFMLNRIRLHIGDRCLVWSVADRFTGNSAAWAQPFMMDKLFGSTFEKAILTVDNGANKQFNNFCQYFQGGITELEIGIPQWAIGMVNMGKVLSGESLTDDDSRSQFPFFQEDDSHDRYAMLSRVPEDSVEVGYSRSRGVFASNLLGNDGYLMNVFLDRWPCAPEEFSSSEVNANGENESGNTIRQMIQFGE